MFFPLQKFYNSDHRSIWKERESFFEYRQLADLPRCMFIRIILWAGGEGHRRIVKEHETILNEVLERPALAF
jgi:hypothetical protein